jgi:hypothetical protein
MIHNELECLCHVNVLHQCNVKQVWSFVGMLNHYNPMIPCCSHLLTLLTALTKKNVKFEWTSEHQQAFDSLKNSLACKVVHAYLDISVPFEICQCLKIPNWICHYPKGQATYILFQETYWSPNKIHCHRTGTACDSRNTS